MMKENLVQEKSFRFSLQLIELYQKLIQQNEFILSKQMLRSGTSIGANIVEASAAFSRKDFIYKMSLSSKEARETKYWLMLLKHSKITNLKFDNYLNNVEDLIKMLSKIVKTSQEKNS